jgi:hypothetical protein
MGSENSDGADNQQERLIELGWVLGFVDGEGCFSIGFVRQAGGRGRSAYKLGYQVAQTMNRRKARPDLVRILRDHTPEIQDTGS